MIFALYQNQEVSPELSEAGRDIDAILSVGRRRFVSNGWKAASPSG
jgi:hypothetical protein